MVRNDLRSSATQASTDIATQASNSDVRAADDALTEVLINLRQLLIKLLYI